jgi:hypothetical protein
MRPSGVEQVRRLEQELGRPPLTSLDGTIVFFPL